MEFFTGPELTTQIGYGKALWPLVLTKELIDNALDICEGMRVPAVIKVTLELNALTIAIMFSPGGAAMPQRMSRLTLKSYTRPEDQQTATSSPCSLKKRASTHCSIAAKLPGSTTWLFSPPKANPPRQPGNWSMRCRKQGNFLKSSD